MHVSHRGRQGLIAGGALTLGLLAGCSDPGALTSSNKELTPSFIVGPPGPGQTYWDFVDLNGSPAMNAGRTAYNNNRTVNHTSPAFGNVKFTATLNPGVPGVPQVVFQWFADEEYPLDEKGIGICRRSPGDLPSPCYTGGEIGEGTETKDLTMDLTGLGAGVTMVSIRLSSLQTGERYKLAFCSAVGVCGADVNGVAGPNDDVIDLPAPAGTKYVILKRGDPGVGANDYLLAGITTVVSPPPPPPGGQGCSPGYWKNHNTWPAPYTKNTQFSAVFENAFPGKTLQQVVSAGGGGLTALGRQTVSALLNAKALGSNYELTPAQVIAKFNAVFPGGNYETLKNEFEKLTDTNGRRCPLN